MRNPDVVIVGAGLAGLICARTLFANNVSVTVLEAASRPGGRCYTSGSGEDLGAEFIQERVHPLMKQELRNAGIAIIPDDGDDDDPDVAVDDNAALTRVLAVIDEAAPRVTRGELLRGEADLDGASLSEYLTLHGLPMECINAFENLIFPFTGCSSDAISALYVCREAAQFGGAAAMLAEGESRVAGGMSALPQVLAKGLLEADALAYDCVAERIIAGEEAVTVHFSGGRSVSARFAVCAVPFNALHNIEFQPMLPAGVVEASQRGHAGHPTKVWIDAGTHAAEQPGILSLRYNKSDRECVIQSKRSSDNADDAGAVADAISSGANPAYHDWTKDANFNGAWLAPRPGMHAALQALRDVKDGRILFAGGDIAPVWPGWAEGAVASGHEVASRLLTRFNS